MKVKVQAFLIKTSPLPVRFARAPLLLHTIRRRADEVIGAILQSVINKIMLSNYQLSNFLTFKLFQHNEIQ
jgi:hypothetical protein